MPPRERSPRAPRRRVVQWGGTWRLGRAAKLACGHVVAVDRYVRGKHTRRACRQCARETSHA